MCSKAGVKPDSLLHNPKIENMAEIKTKTKEKPLSIKYFYLLCNFCTDS